MSRVLTLALVLMLGGALSGCATPPAAKKEDVPAKLVLKPATFKDLPGWNADNQQQTLAALAASCARIARLDPTKPVFSADWAGTADRWQRACEAMPHITTSTPQQARTYFETWFTPVAATADGKAEGLFTGYYEASLRGSLTQGGPYQIPLRLRPDDLVMVNLGDFRDELKGQRIAGRVVTGNLKPYEDRAAIEDGKLPPAQDKVLVWVDSAVDAFFLQIQGSGVITLPDGSAMRVGYDAQNGHPYYAIGKELVKRGHLQQGDVSMQSIRAWLEKNPVEGREVMRLNKSYVFFRKPDKDGAVGGEGLVLTAGRSLAVDRSLMPYGLPIWIDAEAPRPNDTRLSRLMVAQDTGGAIRGPVRGDFFWGFGSDAEDRAGLMKSKGSWWFLLPKP